MNNNNLLNWLMEGVPSISWQTMRDILESDENEILKESNKIEKSGWGKKLLSYQDKKGMWGGKLYNNKRISITNTMALLRSLGG